MATHKKRSIEEFLSFSAPKEREDYVTIDEGDKVITKGKNAVSVYDKKTKKQDISNRAIDVNGELPREEAQAPRPLKSILPPVEPAPAGEPPAAAPKYQAPAPAAAPAAPAVPEQPQGPNVWERLLIGATPALVGLLSGNELEGIQLSGKTLANTEADLYKRERDFAGKLAEMKAKRAMGVTGKNERKPSFATKELFDPKTGKTYVHSIVDGQDAGALGEAPPNKVRDSYVKEVMRNPETGKMEVATINPKTKEVTFHGEANVKPNHAFADLDFQGEPTKAVVDLNEGKVVNYIGKMAEKKSHYADLEAGKNDRFRQQKMIDLTKEFTKPTSNFNKIKENIDGIVTAAEQLNLGNPRANAGLANYLARNVYGEKGPLSDSDIARLAGDPSYGAVIERWLDAKMNGSLGSLDRNDIRQIVEITYKLQKEKAMSEADRFGKAFATVGFDPSPGIKAYVDQAFKPLPAFRPGDITRKPLPSASGKVLMERDGVKKLVDQGQVKEMEKLGAKVVQ